MVKHTIFPVTAKHDSARTRDGSPPIPATFKGSVVATLRHRFSTISHLSFSRGQGSAVEHISSHKDHFAGILNLPLPPLDLSCVGIIVASQASAQIPQTPILQHKVHSKSPSAAWTSPSRSWSSVLGLHLPFTASSSKRSSAWSTAIRTQNNDALWPGWCNGAGTAYKTNHPLPLAQSVQNQHNACSPLILATRQNDCKEMILLLSLTRTGLQECDKDGMTALHWACRLGLVEACLILLLHDAIIHGSSSKCDYTPLYLAARHNHIQVVTFLMQHRVDVNQKSKIHGACAIHAAVAAGSSLCCQTLLDAGALVDARDGDGVTPLWWAVLGDKVDVAKALIGRGADVSIAMPRKTRFELDPNAGATMLWHAVAKSRPRLVRLLLQSGASPVATRPDGKQPLHVAAAQGSLAVVALLLEYGGQSQAVSARGRTALHYAARGGHGRVCELLERCGGPLLDSSHG